MNEERKIEILQENGWEVQNIDGTYYVTSEDGSCLMLVETLFSTHSLFSTRNNAGKSIKD